jgi:transcription antitermination factor NusG
MPATCEPETGASVDLRAIVGTWSVAQVKTQEEHAIARRLTAFGIPSFLPCVEVTRIYPKRKLVVQQPVFRGYLCVAWREDLQRGDILSTRGVYGLKPVLNQGRFLDDLENVAKALKADPRLDTTEEIPLGPRVRVIRGPFVGCVGVYQERREKTRKQGTVVIGSVVMSGGAVLEVDPKDLERI